jgi:hypothetical protein
LAGKLAAQTKQSKLESIADVNEAALDAANGRKANALQLYQYALRLDDSSGDQTASAQDWLAYGQFLDREGYSAQFVFACYAKAELGGGYLDESQKRFLAAAGRMAAKRLGPNAAGIRQNLEPALTEVLTLRK